MTDEIGRLRQLPPPSVPVTTGGGRDQRREWTLARIRRGLIRRANRRYDSLRSRLLVPLASLAAFPSSIYYAIFSGAFRREHLGVLRGRHEYSKQALRLGQHDYLLRRNVHMLEKGLCMRPRRPVFALDYISDTVRCFGAVVQLQAEAPDLVDERQLRWAHDVLQTYFEVTGPHPTIDRERTVFQQLGLPQDVGEPASPYARDLSSATPVTYPDLLRLAYRRRSVRWYRPDPVPRELIDQALEIAALSPSACNRQPFEFRVYDDPELVQRAGSIPKGTRGFVHNFPAFVVIVGRLRAFFSERDRHLIYIDGGLAAMSFVLALESLGISSCCINWADDAEQERAMARTLGLAPDERVVMCISLGYPDANGMVPYSEKRPLDLFRSYNRT